MVEDRTCNADLHNVAPYSITEYLNLHTTVATNDCCSKDRSPLFCKGEKKIMKIFIFI